MTPLTKVSDGAGLTEQERQLISNFRAMKTCAKDMLLDLSGQYRRTLPDERPRLTLAHSRAADAHS